MSSVCLTERLSILTCRTLCCKLEMWLWSFICCVCTTISICHCMHVSTRLDRLVGTELGDLRPSNYRGLMSCLKAPLRIL